MLNFLLMRFKSPEEGEAVILSLAFLACFVVIALTMN
jgi:hypothetical protein